MLFAYEMPSDYKDNRRIVGVICEGALFRIEENPKADRGCSDGNYTIWHIGVQNPYNRKNHWSDRRRVTEASTVLEAKKAIAERVNDIKRMMKSYPDEYSSAMGEFNCPVAALPAGDNSDFYPTPMRLAGKMLACVDWKNVRLILEPSAGKGNLISAVQKMVKDRKYSDKYSMSYAVKENTLECFDVIERDYNLRLILRGIGLRLIDEDFLRFRTEKCYDLVLMNPPFSEGAKHLIHAIGLMENGGQIVCLLNSETVRNPCNHERKLLQKLLIEYNARIEFVKDGFKQAERKTRVEVAIVYLNIPAKRQESRIFENAQKAARVDIEAQRVGREDQMVVSDEVEQMIQFFNAEAKAGIELLRTYDALTPYIMQGEREYDRPMIQVCVGDHKYAEASNEVVNEYLEKLRYKYWKLFLNRPALRKKMTAAMCQEYDGKIRDMAAYDFNRHNIMQVLFDIQSQLVRGVEDAIIDLFETLSSKYCTENQKNIHYYNGWKTNSAYKVGMKAIIPINGFAASYSWQAGKLDEYKIYGTINDLEKSLHYLDKGEIGISYDITGAVRTANANNMTVLHLSYFTVRFYRKGTAHITFRPEAKPIIERLNIFAGRNKGWLPPSYGRKHYKDMNDEEKAVIDAFQGKEAYEQVMAEPSRFIVERSSLQPLLSA